MKNLVTILSISLLLFLTSEAKAQSQSPQKTVVLIEQFHIPHSFSPSQKAEAESLRNKIISSILSTEKVQIIDLKANSLTSEIHLWEEENQIDLTKEKIIYYAAEKYNAKYLIQGNITQINATKKHNDDGKAYFHGSVNVHISVINIEDGTTIHSRSYSHNDTDDSGSMAINRSSSIIARYMPMMVSEVFKLSGNIIEILDSSKSGNAKVVAIDIGKLSGVKNKDKFIVYQLYLIGDELIREEVGKLKVYNVPGDNVSFCKVSKGGDVILQSLENPEAIQLTVETAKKGFSYFSFF